MHTAHARLPSRVTPVRTRQPWSAPEAASGFSPLLYLADTDGRHDDVTAREALVHAAVEAVTRSFRMSTICGPRFPVTIM